MSNLLLMKSFATGAFLMFCFLLIECFLFLFFWFLKVESFPQFKLCLVFSSGKKEKNFRNTNKLAVGIK